MAWPLHPVVPSECLTEGGIEVGISVVTARALSVGLGNRGAPNLSVSKRIHFAFVAFVRADCVDQISGHMGQNGRPRSRSGGGGPALRSDWVASSAQSTAKEMTGRGQSIDPRGAGVATYAFGQPESFVRWRSRPPAAAGPPVDGERHRRPPVRRSIVSQPFDFGPCAF